MKYGIWSNEHGAWLARDRRGYARNLDAAGRYSADEAGQIVAAANAEMMDRPGVERNAVAIPLGGPIDEAPI